MSAGAMICFEHMAFLLVTLFLLATLFGSAVFAILRRKGYPRNGAHKMDIISQLPDDTLVSIIENLPIQFAIRTSILSKRWRNLYKFVSKVDLHCRDLLWRNTPAPHDSSSGVIICRLEKFLRLYSGSKIRSFKLNCCLTRSYTDRFEQCIYSLGKLGIEELLLYFSCCYYRPDDLSFSCHLLSEMPSLKYIVLASCSLQPSLKSRFNSIQTLILVYVKGLHGSLECSLSSCLRLQSLVIMDCPCPSKLCFHCPNLQLKTLRIKHCKGVDEIEFYASNLVKFEFENLEMINFIFDHVPQLQAIYLNLYNEIIMSSVWRKLAKDLPHLKSLTFTALGGFLEESSRLVRMGIETFSNLRQLELSVYNSYRTNLFALIPILQSCPLLQEFHIDVQNTLYDNGAKPGKPHVILLPELKKVGIGGLKWTESEIEFALYILKSAVSLEQMLINRSPRYYGGSGMWDTLRTIP